MPKLHCEIESIEDFEGAKARVYGIYIEEWETSLFDRFNAENEEEFAKELASIERRLQLMASKYGVREDWLKLHEGPPDLHVVALYDDPDSNLRCYGIRFGKVLLVLGGGGPKSKAIRRFQKDDKLTHENMIVQKISQAIHLMIEAGELWWSENGMDLVGNYRFQIEIEESKRG